MRTNTENTEALGIRIDSMYFTPDRGVSLEIPSRPEFEFFCINMGTGIGYLEFQRMPDRPPLGPGFIDMFPPRPTAPTRFLSTQWLADLSQARGPLVSIQHVLWSRQAAIEAEQSISAYREALSRIP